MLTLGAPAFLAAGALLALVPLALHMLARTPPERRPLPTARFLEMDRRTRLRLRRPADLPLLALRMAFLVLLGAAFARPAWVPEREGGTRVVLLDVGAGMAAGWEETIGIAAERLGEEGSLVVFDTAARVIGSGVGAVGALDSLRAAGPGDARSSYMAALRGLRLAAVGLGADTATAELITRPRWGAWSTSVPAAREAAWPARIELVTVGRGEGDAAVSGTSVEARARGRAAVVGPPGHPLRRYVTAAVVALGYEPVAAGDGPGPVELVLVVAGDGEAPAATLPGARSVVVLGGTAAGADSVWNGLPEGGERPRSRGRLVLSGGRALAGWRPLAGAPADGAEVVASWEDGRAAGAAAERDGRCIAILAARPDAPTAAADPGFPHLIAALAGACEPPTSRSASGGALAGVPLDSGATAILRGDALPHAADLSALAGDVGRPLARLMVAVALLVALAETALAYGRGGAR